jgi:phosphoribosylformimino-5-aminoimidazole carboxamide ribotide isomerase
VLKRYHAKASAASFDILPAIDLLGAKVVRLREGEFDRATSYSNDPVATAGHLADEGATWLHVVDLDGARRGTAVQARTIAAIITSVGDRLKVQVAGGLRSEDAVRTALEVGARRVVVGTAALADPDFGTRLVDRFGADSIVVAIDVRDGQAVGESWRPRANGIPAEDAVRALADAGVTRFAVTAIERDGLLAGPDLALLERIISLERGGVIASGGISSISDLEATRDIGCEGAIVGRALYERRISLREAFVRLAHRHEAQ